MSDKNVPEGIPFNVRNRLNSWVSPPARLPAMFLMSVETRFTVPLRPRKKQSRKQKFHRCPRCGGQVRKRSFRCKKCSEAQR